MNVGHEMVSSVAKPRIRSHLVHPEYPEFAKEVDLADLASGFGLLLVGFITLIEGWVSTN